MGFSDGSIIKNPPANSGDSGGTGSIPGSGRSTGGGNDNSLWYSCLEKSHGQRSLAGYQPWGHRVRHHWVTECTCLYVRLEQKFNQVSRILKTNPNKTIITTNPESRYTIDDEDHKYGYQGESQIFRTILFKDR